LVGVVSIEQRTDRSEVKLDRAGPAIATACPSCDAPFAAHLQIRLVTCQYCKTVSRIPERSWSELASPSRGEPWYLLFEGPSRRRTELEEERAAAERKREAAERKREAAERKREATARRAEDVSIYRVIGARARGRAGARGRTIET